MILAQVREGKERIICCASRLLNQAEKAYPATKLECLAIVWAVLSSVHTSWPCHSRYIQTIIPCNG